MKTNMCCCTSVHNHCENVSKIDEIRKKYRIAQEQNDAWYLSEMDSIDEHADVAPESCVFVHNQYDNGLSLDADFLHDIKTKLKESCPGCGKKYKSAEIFQKSFGPGGDTFVHCWRCKHTQMWPERSDSCD